MKRSFRITSLIIAAVMLVTVFPTFASENVISSSALELYVAPDGDDKNSGTKDAPFASIEGARDAIRNLKASSGLPAGGITVHIAEGIYFLDRMITLTEEDSGTSDCPITYVGDGDVLFSGGYFLSPDDFRPISDENMKSRLKEYVRDTVLEYDLTILTEAGIDWGENYQYFMSDRDYKYESQFYVNGTNCNLARYPNKEDGFIIIDQAIPHEQSD